MKFTATLSAQNTNVYVCDIVKPREDTTWFANACASGTFGTGTVTWNISFDNGTTLIPMIQDGTNSAATQTAISAINLRSGHNASQLQPTAKLYASVATATTPSISLIVFDNR